MKMNSLLLTALTLAPQLALADVTFTAPAGNQMSYGDAKEYCKILGAHLPSVREMATLAASQGAAGIKETGLSGSPLDEPTVKAEIIRMAAQGFRMVQKKDLWMPAVDFYYDSAGFQSSQQAGDFNFWSASTDSSASSLAGGMISLVNGTEQKFTLSGSSGNLGDDAANTGRNAVLCANGSLNPVNAPPAMGSTLVTINPAQIEFLAQGKTMMAIISDTSARKIQSVELNTSDLGRDAQSIQISRDYCADQATKATASNKNLRLDLSFQKPEKFCTPSDETIYPVNLTNAN